MRSWIGFRSSLASMVMIVHDSMISDAFLPTVPEAGEAKGSFVLKAYGIFPFVLFERNLIDHRVTARREG